MLSIVGTPSLSSSDKFRFANGVGTGYFTWRPPLKLPRPAAGQHNREIARCVLVGVGYTGPEDDHDVVQQRAVAILGRQ